ncbi:hypothetical protein [Ferruginibacter sp. HRS2-29]|uniref:hypothetical protein n=1 Tax=Ferruginibacter sp. HRS2-29 TaxID=2487334 RepID=UPI0020CD1912|nr:hypothetical protein [Ferruginibacter sp. HRS2-29]MCP9751076.1 hypothetical protein [Ferruginibacter sp. HRS2-29]
MIYNLANQFKDLKNELGNNELFDIYARHDDNEDLIQSHLNIQLIVLNGEDGDEYPQFTFGLDDSFKELIETTWGNMMQYKGSFENENIRGSYSFNHPRGFLEEAPWLTDLVEKDNKDYDIIKNLRIFDKTAVKYQFGCINYQKDSTKEIFENEIYLFHDEHLIHLNLTFREYLSSCVELMACENWQMLFADPNEVSRYSKELSQLKISYNLLSKVFPEKDFELFRKKLIEHKL